MMLGNMLRAVMMASCAWAATAQAQEWPDRRHLPIEPYQKPGKLAPAIKASDPAEWPKEVKAPEGAPNILLIMTDDVGFGASEVFGGPVPTPAYARLASNGLKFNRFHTTAVCSPSRAALITGRNHHVASTGIIMEFTTPYPGYHSLMSRSVGTIGEILTSNGYGTAWFGKNHNVPDWQNTAAGPFQLWPTGLGFEYFYGFLGGDTHQFRPAVFENTTPVEPYLKDPDNYILDKDLADQAVKWIRTQKAVSPKKPFMAYFTPGSAHAPHHAPKDWVEKFKGKFDHGWDKQREMTFARQKALGIIPQDAVLNPTPPEYKRWDDLTPDNKKIAARQMETYAAALSYADDQIGRVIAAIKEMGELDNTLIIYIQGDNGASAEDQSATGLGLSSEVVQLGNLFPDNPQYMLDNLDEFGGPWIQNLYPRGWAHAMNTPFQWDKKIASHLGGTRTSMVMSWPARIRQPGMRSQFTHLTDIVPTILEATGLPAPETINGFKQVPMNGTSMMYLVDDAKAPEQHKTQYFEVIGNQGIYHEGWLASSAPKRLPWVGYGASNPDPLNDYDWELYNLKEDFSQSNNLAKANPKRLAEMRALFSTEAARNQAFPLDDRYIERAMPENRPQHNAGRSEYIYYEGLKRITETTAPNLKNRSWSISADVEIPASGAEGILLTQGGWFGGNALMLLDGKPAFIYARSHYPQHKYRVQAPERLAPGKHKVVVDFAYDGGGIGKGGTATISVDGQQVASGRIDETVPVRFSIDETLDVGQDTGTPVVRDYDVPFRFTGKIEKVVVKVK